MTYIVTSGWWCADGGNDDRDTCFGDKFIRSASFHKLWYDSIIRFTDPEKILVVDSASPIKPAFRPDNPRYEFVSLNKNPGHSTAHSGLLSGYLRAILLGIEYTLQCDVDYHVYIEQDTLLFGCGIVDRIIRGMTRSLVFGDGTGTPQRLQQSFFVIASEELDRFASRLKAVGIPDRLLSPEDKFSIASSRFLPADIGARILRLVNMKGNSDIRWLFHKFFSDYQHLPFGFGRARPIDFSKPFFYFQHGSDSELRQYVELLGGRGHYPL